MPAMEVRLPPFPDECGPNKAVHLVIMRPACSRMPVLSLLLAAALRAVARPVHPNVLEISKRARQREPRVLVVITM